MSELVDCINALSAKDIIKSVAKTANGLPFYLQARTVFSAEYQAVYSALTTKPSDAIARQQNIMVGAMIDAGTWAKRDAVYIHAQTINSDGEALLDWKQPAGGNDLITNGGFDTGAGWVLGAGWAIGGGTLNATATALEAQQLGVLIPGRMYRVTFSITDYTAGSVRIKLGGGGGGGTYRSAVDTFTETIFADGTYLALDGGAAFTGKIDNVSCIEWTNATAYNAPAFVALEGLTGDGATTYIDYNWNPSANGVNYTQNGAGIGVYARNDVDEAKHICGINDAANYLQLAPRNANTSEWSINDDGTDDTAAMLDSRGYFIVNRTAAGARAAYKNAVLLATDAQASTGIPDGNLYGLAINDNGAAASFCTDQLAALLVGGDLTAGERTAEMNAIEVYMDSNGKGVIP